eukprot:jgi/Botrbrau1/2956/Bobra.0026s0025.2
MPTIRRRRNDSTRDASQPAMSDQVDRQVPARRTREDELDISWKEYIIPTLVLFCLPVGCVLAIAHYKPIVPEEIQRLDAPRLWPLEQFKGEYRDRMLWGTYRPGCYLGLRMRFPKSPLVGLMWFDPDDPEALSHIRHLAQERDGLDKYGWERHDGQQYGRQELYDGDYHISTSFVKRFFPEHRGGDWAVRLRARQRPKPEPTDGGGEEDTSEREPKQLRRICFILYIADEGARTGNWLSANSPIQVMGGRGEKGPLRLLASGSSFPIDSWQLHLSLPPQGNPGRKRKMRYMGTVVRHFHNLTELMAQRLAPTHNTPGKGRRLSALRLSDFVEKMPNLAAFQFTLDLPYSDSPDDDAAAQLDFIFTHMVPSDSEVKKDVTRTRVRNTINSWYKQYLGANLTCCQNWIPQSPIKIALKPFLGTH